MEAERRVFWIRWQLIWMGLHIRQLIENVEKKLEQSKEELQNVISRENASEELEKIQKRVEYYEKCCKILMGDLIVEFETPIDDI